MFSPVISTFLLALCSLAFANNNSPVAYTVTSSALSDAETYYATANPAISTSSPPPTVTGTYTTSFSVPIYSCVYYVNATSTGIYTSVTTGRPQHNIFSSYYPIGNITFTSATPTYITTYDSASPSFNGTVSIGSYVPPRSVNYSVSSAPAQASSSAYSFRPLTSTVYATLYTANGTTSTVYGAPTATSSLIGYPSGDLPPCSPYSGGGTASLSTTAEPSGSALLANSNNNDNKPNTGFAIERNFAGVTLGAVAGIALVFL